MTRNYASLHNHSEYSNLKLIDSINRTPRMIDYAWDLNLSAIAVTDHDCLSGSLQALDYYRAKLKKEWQKLHPDAETIPGYAEISDELDFKVVLGNEIYLSEEGLDSNGYGHFWHLILLAKDYEGYCQIRQLSSAAWSRAWMKAILRTPTYPSDLMNIIQGGHVICSTACLGGYAAWCWKQMELALHGDGFLEWPDGGLSADEYVAKLDNHLAAMEDLFGKGNFFIELQPNDDVYGKEQNDYNKFMIERYWGKYPFIFTTDSHYLKEDEREIHKAFLNSKSSNDREVDSFYHYAYMMGQDEVHGLMSYVSDDMFNDMVNNSRRIKDMCKFYELEQSPKLATVQYEHWDEYEEDLDIFEEVDEETYPNFYEYIYGDNKANQYLARLVAHGFNEKYNESWDVDEYLDRLEEEFWTLKEVGLKINQTMADYFITMSKIIDICWNDAGTIVGPSRGSAGALLINYLLGITQMNPIELDLPFVWRFLHPSRPDLPDIDFDTESGKRAAVFNEVKKYFNGIGGDVVNVCTFGTEGTKSAIKTAGRGLDIEDEVVSYVTSMIPNERGFDWSLKECYYGDEEKGRQPIKAFVEQMTLHPRLWELAQNIEGLVTRLGVHASGVVCVNDDFNKYNSYMKTSKGQIVTSYDLHTLERCGMVKYDFLTVSALDRIHQAMNYMLEDGTMEWQGSLKATYNKYLSPEVLDYDDPEMWRMASDGEIRSLFQFDTAVGGQSIKKIQPRSLKQLAIANSIMRLMADGEQPIDIYVKQKTAPQIWYDDMKRHGLTAEEIKVLEKYLKEKDGVAESQEVVMQLSMDPQISGFDMGEANKLRKVIAKKVFKDIEKIHDLYNQKGRALGTSQNLLDYVWDVQFKMSFGYSFSTLHTTGYSIIAVQEMNLAYKYPIIYWNTACLSVDASAVNAQDFYNLIDEDILDTDEAEGKKVQNKMDYTKIASALDDFKRICSIELPDINKSRLGFTPNKERNSILYGLKGITKVTDPAIEEIMMNRPFSSFQDFLGKVTKRVVTKDKIINLIKCGAFDVLEGRGRREILEDYIWSVCDPKKKLTMQNANMLIDMDLLPDELEYNCDVYKLTKEFRKHRDKNKLWYCGDRLMIPEDKFDSWRQIIKDSKIEGEDLILENEPRRVLNSKRWDAFYETKMAAIKTYITKNHDELLEKLNNKLFSDEFNKYCQGDELQWELDSINFYFNGHPLEQCAETINEQVKIDPLENIVEDAQDGEFFIKGKIIPKMKLYTIAGTVVDRDTTKSTVTLQCPDGVVTLKVFKSLFAAYNKADADTGEESFFEKGIHLLVTGIQRGATFVPKVYKNLNRHSIMRIILDEKNRFVRFENKQDT